MISSLLGTVLTRKTNEIELDVNGVGYHIYVSKSVGLEEGQYSRIHTYLDVKENSLQLFGFSDTRERELFKLLISVNGIGPKLAHTLLSNAIFEEIIEMIVNNGKTSLKIPGIGTKKIESISSALKEKILKFDDIEEIGEKATSVGNYKQEALKALVNLGYKRNEAEALVKEAAKDLSITTTEELIKTILKVR